MGDNEQRDTFLEEGKSHETIILGLHGYNYQEHMFLYFCLQLMKMPNCKWTCGFEVKLCEKFDDIIMEFSIDGKNYSYLIQTKHVKSGNNIITLEQLLDVKNTENDSLKKSFALINYANAVEKVDWTKSRQRKFFLLTNYSLDLIKTNFEITPSKKNKKKTIERLTVIAPKTIDKEEDKMIMEFFNDMKTKKFTKFPENIQLCDGKSAIKCKYFLDNFTIVSELPNKDDLKDINENLLKNIFKSNHYFAMREAFIKAFDEKETEVPSNKTPADGVASKKTFICQRDSISMEKFIEIIEKTIVQEDLSQYTAEFVNQFPKWINFCSDYTNNNVQQEYYCSGNAKLFAYMLCKKILAKENEQNGQKTYCVSLSKLKEVHLKYVKNIDGKLVIYIDEKYSHLKFKDYKNVFVVYQSLKQPNKFCQFEDLSEESKKEFLEIDIKYQGFDVKIDNLITNLSLRTMILQEIPFDGKKLEFGTTLPLNELPDYYIKRKFSLKKSKNVTEVLEDDIFVQGKNTIVQGKNTIIQGLSGTGKSTTMLKLAEKVKEAHPDYSVYLVDLKAHNTALSEVKKGKIDLCSTSKVWYFVLNNFLQMNTKGNKDKILERHLLEAQINEKTPKIVIFLDGFDEISPLYSEQVEEIINELKKKNIQIFVSSQPHLNERMQKLKFNHYYTLEPYDKEMQGEFLRRYWTNYVKGQMEYGTTDLDMTNINIFVKKFFKMCYNSKLTDITPSIPLMLNILADIYSNECFEFCKKNRQDTKKFLEIDVLTIYENMFHDNHRKFYRKINETFTKSTFYNEEKSIEKWRKIYIGIALQDLEGDIWKEGQGLDFQMGRAEVFGRGLITGQTINHYEFIYKTFKEYFAADWFTQQLFLVNGKLNIDILKILMKKDGKENKDQIPKGIKSFIYRFILRRLNNLQIIEFEENEKKQLAEFIVGFFQYAWFNRESSQLETTFKIAQIACDKEQVSAVLREKREKIPSTGVQNKNLLEMVPFTSPEQFELSLKIYDEYLTEEETNKILRTRCYDDMASIINLIIKDTNLPLFKKFFEIITKREIFTKKKEVKEEVEKEVISKFYEIFREYLKNQKVHGWMFVRDLYFWYFKQINAIDPLRTITKEYILEEMEIVLKEDKFPGRHYFGHIFASFWEWKEKDDNIIVEAFEKCKLTDTCYRFLYALNSITRDDVLERTIRIMQNHKYNFISNAKRSILFDAFEGNNRHLLRKLLYLLKKDEILTLIGANVCGGTPLIRQCTKENHICEILIQYMVNEFGEKVVDMCFDKPFGNEATVKDNVKIFSIFFRKNIEVGENILERLVERLCEICNNSNLLINIFLQRNTDLATENFMMHLKKKNVSYFFGVYEKI